MQALIKNNVVYCKVCEEHNYKVIDYKTIVKDSETHTKIIARCTCGIEFYFFTKIKVNDEDLHYVFDEETVEIKEKIGMKKITMKQADEILEALNNPEISCEDCALKFPCEIYKGNKNKETICGILVNMVQKMEAEELEKEIDKYVNGDEVNE